MLAGLVLWYNWRNSRFVNWSGRLCNRNPFFQRNRVYSRQGQEAALSRLCLCLTSEQQNNLLMNHNHGQRRHQRAWRRDVWEKERGCPQRSDIMDTTLEDVKHASWKLQLIDCCKCRESLQMECRINLRYVWHSSITSCSNASSQALIDLIKCLSKQYIKVFSTRGFLQLVRTLLCSNILTMPGCFCLALPHAFKWAIPVTTVHDFRISWQPLHFLWARLFADCTVGFPSLSGGPGSVSKYDQQRSGGLPIFPLLEEVLSISLSVILALPPVRYHAKLDRRRNSQTHPEVGANPTKNN